MIKQPAAAAGLRLRSLMESPAPPSPPRKDYVHYQHNDACSLSRWTARESYQFMYAKPWQKVTDFYLDVVTARRLLSELFGKETYAVDGGGETVEDCDKSKLVSITAGDRTGRWARVTFKILLSYHGSSFDGWQKQPGLNTVQGLIERSLGKFVDEKKVQLLKEKKLPIDGCAVVAGRTDKGVTALEQVCSFYTWRKDVTALEIEDAINGAAPGKIRVISVSQVTRDFHPNFSAKWRRYLYIFPFNDENMDNKEGECKKNVLDVTVCREGQFDECFHEEKCAHVTNGDDQHESQTGNKPLTFEISRVNHLLHQLEGKLLSFRMFARDTKASRNIGPPTECFLFHARAAEAYLPCKDGTRTKTMCVELVANRFLRKMVRVLVATAIREAAAGADDDALLKLMDATCRRATAPPAPPDGLCLVDVGYTEFDRKNCLIP
ncbi:tRNA pseudouridine synthase A [Sesamum alatum]|uniref:tRNA pseudouridine synthase n=1 Tax=Sesamum alatum TaxID=300844 RepID=A0AAE1XN58_9LAMI|nr:tRNA pseudouridine synthase A [Sesamum alatum]